MATPLIKEGSPFAIMKKGSARDVVLGSGFKKFAKDIDIEEKNDDYLYFSCRSITADVPNGNWDHFPAKEIKASYETFIGRGFYLDHNSDSIEKAFGSIIDAVLVEKDPKDIHVQCLVKINKKQFPDLCQRIIDGVLNSVSMGCWVAGTPIFTWKGIVPIEDIGIGDKVLTHNGRFKSVTKTFVRPYVGKGYIFKAEGIREPIGIVTEEHPFWTKKDGACEFVEAKNLKTGDLLATPKDNGWLFVPIYDIKKVGIERLVYNMEVEDDNSYVACGVATHNCIAQESECLPPYSDIYTLDGWKQIKDIMVNDLVLTHKGRFKKVNQVFEKAAPPSMFRVVFKGNRPKHERYRSLVLTGNHSLLTNRGWVESKDLNKGDNIQIMAKPCKQCGELFSFMHPGNFCSDKCRIKYTHETTMAPKRQFVAQKAVITRKKNWDNLTDLEKEEKTKKHSGKMSTFWREHPEKVAENARKVGLALKQKYQNVESRLNLVKAGKASWDTPQKRECHLRAMEDFYGRGGYKTKPSNLSLFLGDCLDKEGILHEKEYCIPYEFANGECHRIFLDIAIPHLKIDIECDGEYWHNLPKVKEQDRFKELLLEKYGWTVLRFKEKDIYADAPGCIDGIKRMMCNHGGEYKFMSAEVESVEPFAVAAGRPKKHVKNQLFPFSKVYNLSVEEDESYIAKGIVVHNCSVCGHVSKDKDHYCEHISASKGRKFRVEKDAAGKFVKADQDDNGDTIAYEINRGIVFTELSGVTVPADNKATVNMVWSKQMARDALNKTASRIEQLGHVKEAEEIRKWADSLFSSDELYENDKPIKSEEEEEIMEDTVKTEVKTEKITVPAATEKPVVEKKEEIGPAADPVLSAKMKLNAAEYESLESDIMRKMHRDDKPKSPDVPSAKEDAPARKPLVPKRTPAEVLNAVRSKAQDMLLHSLYRKAVSDIARDVAPEFAQEEVDKITDDINKETIDEGIKESRLEAKADVAVQQDSEKKDKETNPDAYIVEFEKNKTKLPDSRWVVKRNGDEVLSAKLRDICRDGDVKYYTSRRYGILTEKVINQYGLKVARDRWNKIAAENRIYALDAGEMSELKSYFAKVYGKIDSSYFPKLVELHNKKIPVPSNEKLASLRAGISKIISTTGSMSVDNKISVIKGNLDDNKTIYKPEALKELAYKSPRAFEQLFTAAKGDKMTPVLAKALWNSYGATYQGCVKAVTGKVTDPDAFARWLEIYATDRPRMLPRRDIRKAPIQDHVQELVQEEGSEVLKDTWESLPKEKEAALKEIAASPSFKANDGESPEQSADKFYEWLKNKNTIGGSEKVPEYTDDKVPVPPSGPTTKLPELVDEKEKAPKPEVCPNAKVPENSEGKAPASDVGPKAKVPDNALKSKLELEKIKAENEALKKEKEAMAETIAKDRISRVFDEKKKKCFAIVEDMVNKGLITADKENMRKLVNEQKAASIEEAEVFDFKERVDTQITKLMDLDDKALATFAETVKGMKAITAGRRSSVPSSVLAAGNTTRSATDTDDAFLEKLFQSKFGNVSR